MRSIWIYGPWGARKKKCILSGRVRYWLGGGFDPPPLKSRLKQKTKCNFFYVLPQGSRKKILLLLAGPLRSNPPPPSSLMAVEILERWKKRFSKKFFFLNGPANKRIFFFRLPLLYHYYYRPTRKILFLSVYFNLHMNLILNLISIFNFNDKVLLTPHPPSNKHTLTLERVNIVKCDNKV